MDELEKALDDFSRAIVKMPNSIRAHKKRAKAWSAFGEESRANEDYDKAEELKHQKNLKIDTESGSDMTTRKSRVSTLLQEHLSTESPEEVLITERLFPFRMRADLQLAIGRLVSDTFHVKKFFGIKEDQMRNTVSFSDLFETDHRNPVRPVAPQYSELGIGGSETVRCLQNGLWLLTQEGENFAVLLAVAGSYGRVQGMKFQIVTTNTEVGTAITNGFFKSLEDAVEKSECYRGKILSLEQPDPPRLRARRSIRRTENNYQCTQKQSVAWGPLAPNSSAERPCEKLPCPRTLAELLEPFCRLPVRQC